MKTRNTDPKRNSAGQTIDEFLKAYQPEDYEQPSITVDIAILTEKKEVLLIQRANHPNINCWALPGGFMDMNETLYESACRELYEETGLRNVQLKSLGMYGEPTRDPRLRIVTTAFSALIQHDSLHFTAGDDAADARLFTWEIIPIGIADIPQREPDWPRITLPCTAVGSSFPNEANGYILSLTDNAGTEISAILAYSNGVTFLLPGIFRPLDKTLAGDHSLILFDAILSWRLYEL